MDSPGLWSPLDGGNGVVGGRFVWSGVKPYPATNPIGTPSCSGGASSSSSSLRSKLLSLDLKDDEKDIENGMLELSKKLTNELVDE